MAKRGSDLFVASTEPGFLQKWQYGFARTLSTYAASRRSPTPKQAKHGATHLDLAREHIAQTFLSFPDASPDGNASFFKIAWRVTYWLI
jgi:hypothetical protein